MLAWSTCGDWASQKHQGRAWNWGFLSFPHPSKPSTGLSLPHKKQQTDGSLNPTVFILTTSHLTCRTATVLPQSLPQCSGWSGGPDQAPTPLCGTSMTLALSISSSILNPPDTLPIEDATVQLLTTECSDTGEPYRGRQEDATGHRKPRPNLKVCALAKGPTSPERGANPLPPRSPHLLLPLGEAPAWPTCWATQPGAAQSLPAANSRW